MMPVSIGSGSDIDDDATVGYGRGSADSPVEIGKHARVRAGTIIYAGVTIGDDLTTGHHAVIREGTTLGNDVLVGTHVVIDGNSTLGSHVSLQTGCYLPAETAVEDQVFVGPFAVLTNDMYPVRQDEDLAGPTIEEGVSIGANATVLPDVRIGRNAFVAAGAVVTEDVPPRRLAIGAPARHRDLPASLDGGNRLA